LMSQEEEERWDEENEGKELPNGRLRTLTKVERAKALMNQKATSVADVAFVVDLIHREGHLLAPSSVEEMVEKRRAKTLEESSKRRSKKIKKNWMQDGKRAERYEQNTKKVQEGTKWGLDLNIAKRISIEYGGVVVNPTVGKAKMLLPGNEDDKWTNDQANLVAATMARPTNLEVNIFWSDLRDTAYAKAWPEIINHGELERVAISRRALSAVSERASISRSVHVIGGIKAEDDSWMRREPSLSPETEAPMDDLDSKPDDMVGSKNMEDDGYSVKSREEQTEELVKEGILVEPPPRRNIFGWLKRRVGLAA
jgi:hypothetical protein